MRAHRTLLGIIVTGLLLIFVRAQLYGAFDSSAPTLSQYWRFGIGSTDVLTLVDVGHIPRGTLPLIILANLPQAIYSLLYLSYNAALTRMFASREWSFYASKPKAGLRTSWAVGQQRSTYFLQLPLRYAIPFMTLSLVLHWMISQSLFYVAVRVLVHGVERPYTGGKDRGNQSFETLGYSPIAIIMSMITAAVMMVAVVGHAGRKYAPGMPFLAASSAAISAACHSEDGAEIYDKAVKWGVVGVREGVGHCTFGEGEVGELVKGEQYA
jgi:hypothetical protein